MDVEKKEWFKQLKSACRELYDETQICNEIIIKALYKKQEVYYTKLSGALCDAIFPIALLNIEGETIKLYDQTNKVEFNKEVAFIEVIFPTIK